MIYGKDEFGKPAKSHDHAFYLPTDEDEDGRIDHVTVYAPGRFSRNDLSAIDQLRSLSFGKEGEAEEGERGKLRRPTTHRLMLINLSPNVDFGPPLFGSSTTWLSATPYLGPSHIGIRGKSRFMRKSITREWRRMQARRSDLRNVELQQVSEVTNRHPRALEFRRARSKRGERYRPSGYYRLTFSLPIQGPICLGYASHFGMGLFAAVTE
jgi:CRISPR-associated protein Csb2